MQIWTDFPNNSKSLDFKGPKLGTEQKSQKMREFGVCEDLGNVVKLLFWDRVTNWIIQLIPVWSHSLKSFSVVRQGEGIRHVETWWRIPKSWECAINVSTFVTPTSIYSYWRLQLHPVVFDPRETARGLVRVGFSTAGSSLILGESEAWNSVKSESWRSTCTQPQNGGFSRCEIN